MMRRLKAIFRSLNHYLISLTEIRVHGGMLRAHSHHVMDRGGVADGRYEDGLAIRLASDAVIGVHVSVPKSSEAAH